MNWALVDRTGRSLGASCNSYPAAMQSILASLPAESRDELLRLLQEACAAGERRRLSVMQPERPLVVVDILPMQLAQLAENPALVVLHDASEFDGSYDRLKNLARRNEAILRSSMDGFFVVDADCRFLEANEAFCQMIGYTADELLRMKISDLEVDEHANGGVPSHTRTGLHHFPTAHRHKDGHIVYLDISVNVLHDNGVKILVGLARDVTERKRAEDELARLSRQQRLILDSAAEGIAGLDHAGKITLMNPAGARMFGYSAGELIGRSVHEVFSPSGAQSSDCPASDCAICNVLKSRSESLQAEQSFARADGTQFPVEYSITSMREDGKVIGAVLVFKDMTESRRAERERRVLETQIQQAQKLESLGLLAGGIAHDLNNMLAGVQGNACLALAEVPEEGSVRGRLQRIVGACERASKFIRQILTYSGHVACEASPLDLNELVADVSEFMRAVVPKTMTLQTRLEPELPLVEADSGQLHQTMTSLLVNAIEAIGDRRGRITLSTKRMQLADAEILRAFPGQSLRPGEYVGLRVEDTGCGMSPETLERIFEPFFSGKGTGRGLGLSAMHGVVRAHGGGVRVESGPGKGTRFTLVFPATGQPAVEECGPNPQPRVQAESVVLVVDDEDEVREVIKDMLTYHGLQVLTAKDGTRGVEIFRRHADAIDVVILDMVMPDKSGAEVFREIVAVRPDAKIVVASGHSLERTPARFGDVEPAAYLNKPFVMDTLIQTISNVLGEDRPIATPPVGEQLGQGRL